MNKLELDRVVESLCDEEGYRRFSYLDHLGYETVGIGRCIAEGAGYGIDEEEALYLLRRDVERVTGACKLAFDFWDEMSGNIQATMVELTFQMGLSGYRKFRKHHYALGRGDFATAAKELLNSKFARQTPARAQRMAARILDG